VLALYPWQVVSPLQFLAVAAGLSFKEKT